MQALVKTIARNETICHTSASAINLILLLIRFLLPLLQALRKERRQIMYPSLNPTTTINIF
jgi:hypothetical protein